MPNEDVLLTAALFHDIGRSKSTNKIMKVVMPGHGQESARMLIKLLDGIISKDILRAGPRL